MDRRVVLAAGVLLVLLVYYLNAGTVETPTHQQAPVGAGGQDAVEANLTAKCTRQPLAEEPRYAEARRMMVETQLMPRDIRDGRVLAAMSAVSRQEFVPDDVKAMAYADSPQPIGYGQTISQPYIVALMTQELGLNRTDRVLEVGTGSGYQVAVLSELVDGVYTMEIIRELAMRANNTLQRLGYCNAKVSNADGYFGWSEHAPYDAIMITAAVDHIPHPLTEQLAEGGRLILPLGSTKYYQTLTLVEKKNGELNTEYITDVVFVPLTGEALKH